MLLYLIFILIYLLFSESKTLGLSGHTFTEGPLCTSLYLLNELFRCIEKQGTTRSSGYSFLCQTLSPVICFDLNFLNS